VKFTCDITSPCFATTTPLLMVRPEAIRVLSAPVNVLAFYQNRMSKAVWRPAAGRKMGFVVVQDDALLGLIFLASPVNRMIARDRYLFPNAAKRFQYGTALRDYLDLSICVAAQPIGWHWNLGKLMALIAPTLGDYVEARYPMDKFKGVTTTSIYGGNKATQYTRIYKHLGETKGFGHEHIGENEYESMLRHLRERGLPIPSARFSDGSTNVRMQRIAAYKKAVGEKLNLRHGHKRGVYYHPATPPEQRQTVIHNWYERWGLPRYERTKNWQAPYQNGRDEIIEQMEPTPKEAAPVE
jgi:hypothetical protein